MVNSKRFACIIFMHLLSTTTLSFVVKNIPKKKMNFYLACVLFIIRTSSRIGTSLYGFFFYFVVLVQFFFGCKKKKAAFDLFEWNRSERRNTKCETHAHFRNEKTLDARSRSSKAHAVNEYFAINYLFNVIGC